MVDEYIRLDTTIMGIDGLINEAPTGSQARALYCAKDMIYDQQRYVIDVQPVKHGRWIPQGDDMWLCSNCKENIIFSMSKSDRTEKQRYCCRCGARMDIVYQDDKITAIKVTGGDAE